MIVRVNILTQQAILSSFHESSKENCCKHNNDQSGRPSQFVLLLCEIVSVCPSWIEWNHHYQSKGNCSSDHSSIRYEQQLPKVDGLLSETESKQIESSNHGYKSSHNDDEELRSNPGEAPV